MRPAALVLLAACKSAAPAPDAGPAASEPVEPNRACAKDADCALTASCACPNEVCPHPPDAIAAARLADYRMACMARPCPHFDPASISDAERANCPPVASAWVAACDAGRCVAAAR